MSPFLPASTPTPSPGLQHTTVRVHGLWICILANLFTFFYPVPLTPLFSEICQAIPCIHASGSALPVYFFHWISHINEIIWYFSFSDCLISLGIIISRSIHAVTKDKHAFLFTASSIPLCKCTIYYPKQSTDSIQLLLKYQWRTP